MKKGIFLFAGFSILFLCYCSSTRHRSTQPPVTIADSVKTVVAEITYRKHIEPILVQYCVPCHFPESGGKDGPLDAYDTVKAQINDILYRIELEPREFGFMPAKDKKLTDSIIQVFHRWKKQGLPKG